MIEVWRGGLLESYHAGHAVICDDKGEVIEAWGDPGAVVYPRSSAKMLQALPLIETGAADAFGLKEAQLAFACASHIGQGFHVKMAEAWVKGLGLSEADLRCGAHEPSDKIERDRLIAAGERPCQFHNNCSGKHSGFLTVTKHLGAGPEYVEIDHPLQKAIVQAMAEVTGEEAAGWGVDGCSAPNFALTVAGMARAMGRFAGASGEGDARDRAMFRLASAMRAFPEMVSGDTGADTELMRAMDGRVALKGGAEAYHIAIIPELKRGIALKIVDGGARASDAVMVALLVRLGVLDANHPAAKKRLNAVQKNWRGIETGVLKLAEGFL
ncbi:asparaginase [Stagnihabitans tardus]|uniref:Asparaginase n=1 Tax=Stagnihabitans tardus TaxID=2699202 RepID=A0AAE4YEA8_9RHOB|nr:asparaginase [Stagnihabitans tardus]NBZ88095.1 asparaginase [Stagnihabitans tardus]